MFGGRLYYQVDPHAQARLFDTATASNINILQGIPPALMEGKSNINILYGIPPTLMEGKANINILQGIPPALMDGKDNINNLHHLLVSYVPTSSHSSVLFCDICPFRFFSSLFSAVLSLVHT